MDRAEFFRWGLKSLKDKSLDVVTNSFGAFSSLAALAEEKWYKVAVLDQLTERPKLMFWKGKAFYLALAEEKVVAFKPNCPVDQGQIQWQPNLNSFYCISCKSAFSREGKELTQYKVKVEERSIYISFD